jgi:2-keto-4-pentenoate hydratase/2-oxohepta-3-ene-1,7-dioic acid hydratase in catechol pathway
VRLATIRRDDGPGLAVVEGDEVADVAAVAPDLPRDMAVLLGAPDGLAELAAAAGSAPRLPLSSVELLAPVLRPPKFLAIGLNYAKHVEESGAQRPEHQVWFNKQSTCVVGPGAPIELPSASSMVDYEGELAFVIGRRCQRVSAADAPSVIAGYTIVNDVSARDWQFRAPTWTMGKSFDTHGPTGPWIVTPDELGDPHRLRLRTWVNGELRQDASTDDLIFDCYEQVEFLSTACTLEPGDLISTGTPAGVGMAMQPPQLLAAGDVVRIEIEGIGVLENPVVAGP